MKYTNGDIPAMPCKVSINRDEGSLQEYQFGNNDFVVMGLTKRERFAMAAMQGFAACGGYASPIHAAHDSVKWADALLAELEKSGGE